MAEPQLLLNYTGHLPECPTWSAEEQALYWADILEGEIHRYHLSTAEHTVLSFHEEVGCFALREQGGFIVAMRTGIWLTDKHGLLRRKVCDNPLTRSWRVLTMEAPTISAGSMRARSGGREITTAPC